MGCETLILQTVPFLLVKALTSGLIGVAPALHSTSLACSKGLLVDVLKKENFAYFLQQVQLCIIAAHGFFKAKQSRRMRVSARQS